MDVPTFLTTVIAFISLFLIIRNLKYSNPLDLMKTRLRAREGDDLIELNGRLYRPIIYVGEPLSPARVGDGLGLRLSTLVRQTRVNAALGGSLVKISKDRVLRELEESIEKLRLAYEATKHVKYVEKLTVLERLYKDVARSVTPYAGSFYLIVWLAENEPETRAEALRSLVEAETGVRLERFPGRVSEALLLVRGLHGSKSPIPLIALEDNRENNIIIGVHPEYNILFTLSWPSDFETHLGIIGPTGRGKTILMSLIAFQLYSRFSREASIVVIDPKGDMESLLEKGGIQLDNIQRDDEVSPCIRPGAYRVSGVGSQEKIGMGKRVLANLIQYAEENGCRVPTVVFVDEAWRFLVEAREYMEASVREGRSRGLYIVYATQTPRDVPKDIVDNTGTLMVFGGYTRAYAESAESLGLDPEDLLGLPVGTVIVKRGGETTVVRVFNYEDYVKKPAPKSRIERRRGVTRIG